MGIHGIIMLDGNVFIMGSIWYENINRLRGIII
jgi:hypothetical protein